jgi:hypothetical protein
MDEAEDVVQEAFMKTFICLHQFRGESRGDLAPDHRCEYCIKAFFADIRADEPELKMVDGC